MAFNYDTLTQNCGSMKTTSDTFEIGRAHV